MGRGLVDDACHFGITEKIGDFDGFDGFDGARHVEEGVTAVVAGDLAAEDVDAAIAGETDGVIVGDQ